MLDTIPSSSELPPVTEPAIIPPLRATSKLPCRPSTTLHTVRVSDVHAVATARVPPLRPLALYLAVPKPPPLNDTLPTPLVP